MKIVSKLVGKIVPRLKGGHEITIAMLSVIVVVVGLVAGLVVVGYSFIHTAEVHKDITVIEQYKQATVAFREKYGYLPGDIPAALVVQLHFKERAGTEGRGDGNGLLQGYVYTTNSVSGNIQTGEPLFFWEDLFSAVMIKDSFVTASDSKLADGNAAAYLPDAHMGKNNRIYVYSARNANYYGISNVSGIDSLSGAMSSTPGLKVSEAYDIDHKIDDGLPATGKVLARYVDSEVKDAPLAAISSPSSCYDTTSTRYSLMQNNGAGVNCALSFQFDAL